MTNLDVHVFCTRCGHWRARATWGRGWQALSTGPYHMEPGAAAKSAVFQALQAFRAGWV